MTVLHLGVVEVPYVHQTPAKVRRVAVRSRGGKPIHVNVAPAGGETTGDVATWLEDRYGVMQHFFDLHGQEIAEALEQSMAGALENLLMGAPHHINPLGDAEAQIGTLFRTMLDSRELERIGIPGVPTKAALKGVNHRRKHPNASDNPPRPSFIDTGTYQASFKAWLD